MSVMYKQFAIIIILLFDALNFSARPTSCQIWVLFPFTAEFGTIWVVSGKSQIQ